MTVCAGVDGCKGGWIVVRRGPGTEAEVKVFAAFVKLLEWLGANFIAAVDMPIGLPDRGAPGGRIAERTVRKLLQRRRGSIFSIPSRSAVYAQTGAIAKGEYLQAHARASENARQTSDSSAGVSIQAFGIFPKIREIDALLRAEPDLSQRLHESHPEIAFRQLNGGSEMTEGKLTKAGEDQRRQILARWGFSEDFLRRRKFSKAKADDFLDACAMLAVAERIKAGIAVSHPSPPGLDAFGLPIAIWA